MRLIPVFFSCTRKALGNHTNFDKKSMLFSVSCERHLPNVFFFFFLETGSEEEDEEEA